jgi:hypothetical protein
MRQFRNYLFGSALLATGLLATHAHAFMTPGKVGGQISADRDRIVTFDHRPAHTDCKKDKKGRSHFHKGMKDMRVNCPGGKK